MSYQVLARKWRPRTFSEMQGQEHVLQALINALNNNRLHHAYLFTGTRGVGKTTIARILAKCLNCEQGVSATPCGDCGACRELAEGRFVDLIEVDAASRTKVEDTRELLENVQYAPTRGRYKLYLIDEVHMLSTHSFNALLKTLEEPPPHVKFLLATTDPQKLPVTILSRCLQFNLKNLSPERIAGYLSQVLDAEQVPFEEAALWSLARSADGSMRDALSLTDQAIAHGGGKVTEAEVHTMLGTIDRSAVIAICNALADGDIPAVLARVETLSEQAPDYSAALADILSVWHRVAIAQASPDALDNSQGDHSQILTLANKLSREAVQLFYQIALLGRRDLPLAADPRSGFEMVLLRQLAFQPITPADIAEPPPTPVTAGPEVPEQERPPVKKCRLGASSEGSGFSVLGSKLNSEAAKATAPEPKSEIEQAPVREPIAAESSAPEPVKMPEHASMPESKAVPLAELTPERWIAVYHQLNVGGLLQNIAANLVLVDVAGNELRFVLDSDNSSLYEESYQERMAALLHLYFGRPVRVAIEVGRVMSETPWARMQRLRAERQAKAVQTLRDDPRVQQLIERFDGRLIEDSVIPKV